MKQCVYSSFVSSLRWINQCKYIDALLETQAVALTARPFGHSDTHESSSPIFAKHWAVIFHLLLLQLTCDWVCLHRARDVRVKH